VLSTTTELSLALVVVTPSAPTIPTDMSERIPTARREYKFFIRKKVKKINGIIILSAVE
jgi:hypothetical protein